MGQMAVGYYQMASTLASKAPHAASIYRANPTATIPRRRTPAYSDDGPPRHGSHETTETTRVIHPRPWSRNGSPDRQTGVIHSGPRKLSQLDPTLRATHNAGRPPSVRVSLAEGSEATDALRPQERGDRRTVTVTASCATGMVESPSIRERERGYTFYF